MHETVVQQSIENGFRSCMHVCFYVYVYLFRGFLGAEALQEAKGVPYGRVVDNALLVDGSSIA